jgi:protein TonB
MKPRRFAVLVLVLLAGTALAQQKEQKAPRYEPAEVLAATEAPYPPNSVAAGTVILEATVSASGTIEEIRKVRDVPSLSDVAERSLKQWKFRPATLDGRPVRSKVTVAFTFTRPIVTPMRPQS